MSHTVCKLLTDAKVMELKMVHGAHFQHNCEYYWFIGFVQVMERIEEQNPKLFVKNPTQKALDFYHNVINLYPGKTSCIKCLHCNMSYKIEW